MEMKSPIDYRFAFLEEQAKAKFWRGIALSLLGITLFLALVIKFKL
jgi:hypothetical protein